MHFNIFPMWHLFTALACRVFCRSSVGFQAVCSGLGMGEGEVGYFERTWRGGGLCMRPGVFLLGFVF